MKEPTSYYKGKLDRAIPLLVLILSLVPLGCNSKPANFAATKAHQETPQLAETGTDPESQPVTAEQPVPAPEYPPQPSRFDISRSFRNMTEIINTNPDQRELFFESIENHETPTASRQSTEGHDHYRDGHNSHSGHHAGHRVPHEENRPQCNDVSINSVYESLLAKNVMTHQNLNRTIFHVFGNLLASMSSDPKLKGSLETWEKDDDETRVLPVTQKHKLHNKLDELKHGHDNALALDYILYNARRLDRIGIGEIDGYRDNFYSNILSKSNGKRINQHNGLFRNQYGIVKFDIPALEVPEGRPWQHWGRDTCHLDPDSSSYNRNAARLQIPIACGLSGTTTLAVWSLLKSKIDLSEDEVRMFLLSLWSSLCADGGHSLQEVLSSTQLNVSYVTEKMKDRDFRKRISMTTLKSLSKVTEDMAPLGDPGEAGKFGRYYDSFFSKIHDRDFKNAREKAGEELLEYLKNDCL